MTAPEVIEVEADGVRATASFPLTHECPYRDETDHGTVELTWTVEGRTLELHSVAEWLRTFEGRMTSHEALTARLWAVLAVDLTLPGVVVTTEWDTAGGHVRVSTA